MHLITEPYLVQKSRWPCSGKHILAQYDDESIIVYQAYCRSIGQFAATNGYFGSGFSLNRMSWIKPNFLWMMFRCGWASKDNQQSVLAIRLKRAAFDTILEQAVHSSYVMEVYGSQENWKSALAQSNVRLQWDPDHTPSGEPVERRAIQLGLRGTTLAQYARDWILGIEDISDFVRTQHKHVVTRDYSQLVIPREEVYPVNEIVAARLGMVVSSQEAKG